MKRTTVFKPMLLLLLSIPLLTFNACNPDPTETGSLKITFRGQYNGETLLMAQSIHNTPEGHQIRFSTLDFFVADVKIKDNTGNATNVEEIAWIDFNNNHYSTTTAELGESFIIEDIPVGDYTALDFGIGVPVSLNNQEPGDFSTSSPLGNIANYWAGWNSYIFSRVEGHLFTSTDTTAYLYHTGVDGSYQERSFSKDFSIAADQTTEIIFIFDAQKIFSATGNSIDLVTNPSSHSGEVGSEGYELTLKTIQNIADGLTIQ